MPTPSSLPPIADPNNLQVALAPDPIGNKRSWQEAPFVVRICAFYLILLTTAGMIYGLSLIAYVQLLRSNFLLLALCVAGISALVLFTGYYLTALHRGAKWSWYVQAIWSVEHTSGLVIGFLMTLISGNVQMFISDVLQAASPFAAYISLSHIVISLLWFQTKVKAWFGLTRAKT